VTRSLNKRYTSGVRYLFTSTGYQGRHRPRETNPSYNNQSTYACWSYMRVHPYVCASNGRWFNSMASCEDTTSTTGTHFASRDRVPGGKAGKPLGTATVSSSAAVPVRSSGSTGSGFSNASSGSRDPKDVARFCGQNTRRQGGVDTAAMPTTEIPGQHATPTPAIIRCVRKTKSPRHREGQETGG
jgi:hypothetical protein